MNAIAVTLLMLLVQPGEDGEATNPARDAANRWEECLNERINLGAVVRLRGAQEVADSALEACQPQQQELVRVFEEMLATSDLDEDEQQDAREDFEDELDDARDDLKDIVEDIRDDLD